MHSIDSLPLLELGNQNESGATSVVIDVSAWDDYTLQVAANPGVSDGLWITYIRPGETTVYPVDAADLEYEETETAKTLTWTVSNAVTENAGLGTVIVNLTDTGVEKKSSKTHMMIKDGHAAAGDPPEPLASYIEKWGAVDLTGPDWQKAKTRQAQSRRTVTGRIWHWACLWAQLEQPGQTGLTATQAHQPMSTSSTA